VDVEIDADVSRLRGVLRDLVALSATPAVWIGSEPPAVAAGLADALVSLLQLDFVYVRLSHPDGGSFVEATRGSAWKGFPAWLEGHLAAGAPVPRKEVVRDVGDASAPRRGFAVPIGVNGEAGLVAAAAERNEFPTRTDQLLLSVASNNAAAAFQNARLIDERRRAEEELREARTDLERKVSQRTAELHVANKELSALRRLATLVAEGVQPQDVFVVVAQEVARVVNVRLVSVVRYEPEGTGTEYASFSPEGPAFPIGKRWSLEGTNVLRLVRESAEPSRIDDHSKLDGEIAEVARRIGIRSTVAVPIVVAGRVWGAMVVSTTEDDPLPPATEARLAEFTELVATAVENAESRDALEHIGAEQAALRRVATLVAEDVPASQLFGAVAREVGSLLGADFSGMARFDDDAVVTVAAWAAAGEHPPVPASWQMQPGDPATTIAQTRKATRWDDWTVVPGPLAAFIRELGVRSTVGTPIVVEGRLWGALAAHSTRSEALPPDTESRMAQFTALVATAVANAEARAEVARLAEEQAALRRVATLVAGEASPAEVFAAIAEELGRLMGVDHARMWRFENGAATTVASAGVFENAMPVGVSERLHDYSLAGRVLRTGHSQRVDDYTEVGGPTAQLALNIGVGSAVATPIVAEGRVWGAMLAAARQPRRLAADTESRMAKFTELMATAIANTESHARADRLAAEQASLRRVATLVAKEPSLAEVFATVAEEVAKVVGDVDCVLWRDEGDGTGIAVAVWGASVSARVRVGTRVPLDGEFLTALVLREGRPKRIDDYRTAASSIAERVREIGIRSAVGAPIVVGGRTWGAMAVAGYEAEPLPPATETLIAQFADLVATAVANAEARAEVERLAAEQAALRRVATLVAEGAPPSAVFDAVAGEMATLLDADQVAMNRFEPADEMLVLAHRGLDVARTPVGSRVNTEGESATATVRRTGRPARIDNYERAEGALAEIARATGLRSSVSAPIVVEGRLWGLITASWKREQSPPADTEDRMLRFAQLLDTAIANADSRDQLSASRARLLTEGDDARRRVVRDLHDGAQQRLVHTIVSLKLAQRALRDEGGKAESLVGEALEHAEQGNAELRELAHGILPAVLTRGGLRAGVGALVARLDVPVDVDVPAERFPAETEASAYFIVAEALTNVVKHSHAQRAEVRTTVHDGMLHIEVRDDGVGGADPNGHGLVGVRDRVTALGGRLDIEASAGGGTLVAATLPLPAG
jgi:GAF domain-containing protein